MWSWTSDNFSVFHFFIYNELLSDYSRYASKHSTVLGTRQQPEMFYDTRLHVIAKSLCEILEYIFSHINSETQNYDLGK